MIHLGSVCTNWQSNNSNEEQNWLRTTTKTLTSLEQSSSEKNTSLRFVAVLYFNIHILMALVRAIVYVRIQFWFEFCHVEVYACNV